ncbi:hypothetical protein ZWY2020_054639 [Hordeum vulgare]|nr:hypothetical protein ZWY2020_054639 [Hordeum vulgare]
MRLISTDMKDKNMLFSAIPSICTSSPKISIYNEEMIVARCFIGFCNNIYTGESSLFRNNSSNSSILTKMSLRICSIVVESLPMARCAPKCEKTVQPLLCRNLNVKSETLLNATSSHHIRLQDDIVTGFHF